MVNTENSIEEEIKERIAAGNRTYLVHKKIFKSKYPETSNYNFVRR